MHQQVRQQWGLLAIIGMAALVLIGSALAASLRSINSPFPGFFIHDNLTVGPYFLPGWSGQQAGLRSLDRVVAVNGSCAGAARRFLRARAAGTGRHFNALPSDA